MALDQLTKAELHERFLRVHNEYLEIAARPIREIADDPAFKDIRNELRLALDELRRRREESAFRK